MCEQKTLQSAFTNSCNTSSQGTNILKKTNFQSTMNTLSHKTHTPSTFMLADIVHSLYHILHRSILINLLLYIFVVNYVKLVFRLILLAYLSLH